MFKMFFNDLSKALLAPPLFALLAAAPAWPADHGPYPAAAAEASDGEESGSEAELPEDDGPGDTQGEAVGFVLDALEGDDPLGDLIDQFKARVALAAQGAGHADLGAARLAGIHLADAGPIAEAHQACLTRGGERVGESMQESVERWLGIGWPIQEVQNFEVLVNGVIPAQILRLLEQSLNGPFPAPA